MRNYCNQNKNSHNAKGMVETVVFIYLGAAIAAVGLLAGTYHKGKVAGEIKVQAEWNKDKEAAAIKMADLQSKNLAFAQQIEIEQAAAKQTIELLATNLKQKVYKNETATKCPTAVTGSVLLTPDRVRDIAAIYNSGLRKNNSGSQPDRVRGRE